MQDEHARQAQGAGPRAASASAGPDPMPLPTRPCTIGTSVSVAKYMKAPAIAANTFDAIELPPTRPVIHCGRQQPLVSGPAQQEARHEHAAKQQRHDLLRVRPCLVEPLARFVVTPGREPRETEHRDQEGPRRVGWDRNRGYHGCRGDDGDARKLDLEPAPEHHGEHDRERRGQPPLRGEDGGEEARSSARRRPSWRRRGCRPSSRRTRRCVRAAGPLRAPASLRRPQPSAAPRGGR